jgi:hypothetical protein
MFCICFLSLLKQKTHTNFWSLVTIVNRYVMTNCKVSFEHDLTARVVSFVSNSGTIVIDGGPEAVRE